MSVINFRNVSKSFPVSGGTLDVLQDLNFALDAGEILTVFGPNGCGKSTILGLIGGAIKPTTGAVTIDRNIYAMIPTIVQDYRRSLLPWLNVESNAIFPLTLAGVPRREARARLRELVERLDLSLDLTAKTYNLSGGQAQMLCMVRALVVRPRLVLMDEPFSAVDFHNSLVLRQHLYDFARQLQLTLVFVSHDLDEALFLSDRVLMLSQRPARVVEALETNLPKARDQSLLTSPIFNTLRSKALSILHGIME